MSADSDLIKNSERAWRAHALGYFVPEQPDAYAERKIAAVGSYHLEFQHNRTAVKVSIPNGMLAPGSAMDDHDTAVEIGHIVLDAAREAKR